MQQELRFEVNGREFELFHDGKWWMWTERNEQDIPIDFSVLFPTAHEAHVDAIRYASTTK